jgi:hypothetical protein
MRPGRIPVSVTRVCKLPARYSQTRAGNLDGRLMEKMAARVGRTAGLAVLDQDGRAAGQGWGGSRIGPPRSLTEILLLRIGQLTR